jgi:hypothetical protein
LQVRHRLAQQQLAQRRVLLLPVVAWALQQVRVRPRLAVVQVSAWWLHCWQGWNHCRRKQQANQSSLP